jgi:hypothetical protein
MVPVIVHRRKNSKLLRKIMIATRCALCCAPKRLKERWKRDMHVRSVDRTPCRTIGLAVGAKGVNARSPI